MKRQTALTYGMVKASKPGDDLSDPSCPGLRYIHNDNDLRYWQYRYRNTAGILRRMTLGHWPEMGIKDARDAWAEQKRIRRQGRDPLDVRDGLKAEQRRQAEARRAQRQLDGHTVNRLLDDWLEYQENRIKSYRKVKHHVDKDLRPAIGHRPVADIVKADCLAILDPIEKLGQIHRRNRVLDYARGAWNWALDQEKPGVVVNPWGKIKRLHEAPKERHLSNAELRRFLRWLPGAISGDIGEAQLLVLLTGCRPGEIASARAEAVDPDERTLRLEGWETKNGYPHVVYLSRQAWELVKKRIDGQWLFPSPIRPKNHIRVDTLSERLKDAIASSAPKALPPFTPHDLRRSMASWLGEREDCPPQVIQRMLNHVQVGVTTKHYNLAKLNKPAKDWWQKWADHCTAMAADDVVVKLRA